MNIPARNPNVDSIDLHGVACRVREALLQDTCVAQRKTLQQEIHTQCLSNTRDEVLSDESNGGWLEEDWSD